MQAQSPTLEQDPVIDREGSSIVEPDTGPAERESAQTTDPGLALAIVELELALDAAQANRSGFSEAVRDAIRSVGGDFLFTLPAAGLAREYQKVAAVRLSTGGDRAGSLAFVLLSEDGTRMTVQPPDERTDGLARFADAFIDVLERF